MFAVVSSFFFEKKITAKDVERKIEKKHKEFAKSIVDHILQYSRNNRKKYQICGVQASGAQSIQKAGNQNILSGKLNGDLGVRLLFGGYQCRLHH
ncbi:hypothetical protein B9Z55_021866 [Caenorhabditis nigoni]|uniref:Uncharacterized protein n=1 Tax=Caenorhabditis nigoni TaxID=1611254 RepID=A0A2G5TTV8_9PELO|nr:hypothetical protein B9Z55_021866 [Caenorhabditis nigoni]